MTHSYFHDHAKSKFSWQQSNYVEALVPSCYWRFRNLEIKYRFKLKGNLGQSQMHRVIKST